MKKPFHRRWPFRILLAALILGLAVWFGLPWLVPLPASVSESQSSPVLRDRHGEPLYHLRLPDYTRRAPVSLDEIPQDLINCTIAAEDKRFWSHGGVDLLATARAIKDWVKTGDPVSGASTITQQYIKLSQPPQERNLRTKFIEALQARRLEMTWSKKEILTAYLNRLDYGYCRLGPAEASRFYYQKPLNQLSLGECSLMAGLPQAPTRLNPVDHLDRALARREVVLNRLNATTNYDESRISIARSELPEIRSIAESKVAPWLTGMMSGDSRVTLDAGLQGDVESIVSRELEALKDSNLHHMAVVVIDNPTGEILALVSSGDWDDERGGKINGALTLRSPGSALKPFTYLLSFESGRSPGSIIADIPTRFRTGEGLDLPQNYDRQFRGPVTIRESLACSLNIPAMRELNRLGGPGPLVTFLKKLDVLDEQQSYSNVGLGLTIGGAPVRLLDLTNAYATHARGGMFMPAKLAMETPTAQPERVMDQRAAWLVADIMSDPVARAPQFGRNGPLELPFPCAVKTGTSSDYRDNWCLGFTKNFTVGVWAGNFDHSPMRGLSGVAGAGPVFRDVMLRLHKDVDPAWIERPDGLVSVRIDPRTGRAVGDGAPNSCLEWFFKETSPLPAREADYDEKGRVVLDQSYTEWLGSKYNRRRSEFASISDVPVESPLRILAPRPNATYVLDPELPNDGRLHLATNLPGLVEWTSDTLQLRSGSPEPVALLTPGQHVLSARDPRSGEITRVAIQVEER